MDSKNIYFNWHNHDRCRSIDQIHEHGQHIEAIQSEGRRGSKKQIHDITLGAGAGVTRFPAVVRRLLFKSFDRIIPDLLHLYFRTTERILCDYFSLMPDLESRAQLSLRLQQYQVGMVAFTQKNGEKDRWHCSLVGRQCDQLLSQHDSIIVALPTMPKKYLDCWQAFAKMWNLLFTVTSCAEQVEQQIASIAAWKQEVSLTNRDMSIHNNSAHVIWQHLPYYLQLYGASGGLGRFSQEGTELQVKFAKEALGRNISKSSPGNKELIERQMMRIALQTDEVDGAPLATRKKRKYTKRRKTSVNAD
jgi:hypothetical protein